MIDSPAAPAAPSQPAPATRRSWWKFVLLALVLLLLGLVALWWWHNRPIKAVQLNTEEKAALEEKLDPAQPGEAEYQPGGKEIVITERELNGLLNEHTDLGDRVSFQLVPGAVHARVVTDLDPDVPVVGGKKLKARARFLVETRDGVPELILDDLTVWGLSLPNDWLGGLKGQNLLGELLGDAPALSGLASLEVERGRLVLTLKD
jgi:hypothetical protein